RLIRDELLHHLCGRVRTPAALARLRRVRGVGHPRGHYQHDGPGGGIALAAGPGGEASGDRSQLRGQFFALALRRVQDARTAGGPLARLMTGDRLWLRHGFKPTTLGAADGICATTKTCPRNERPSSRTSNVRRAARAMRRTSCTIYRASASLCSCATISPA